MDKARVLGSLISVVLLILPITMQVDQTDERWYSIEDLPITEEWRNGYFNQTVIIHITEIAENVTLVISYRD